MGRYVIKRLLQMILVIIGVMIIVFVLQEMTPGDPVDSLLGAGATQEQRDNLRSELGLDEPVLTRFVKYIGNFVTKGDLGTSYTTKQPVMGELLNRWPVTFKLAIGSIFVALLVGLPLGILSAVKQNTIVDYICRVLSLAAVSMPQFWLGLLFILFFAMKLHWLPSFGLTSPLGWIMPIVTCGLTSSANVVRITRSSMLDVVRQDYINTARAKGQKENVIILKHGLRNALIPIITTVGTQFGAMLGGSIAIESVFSLPGLGQYLVTGLSNRNYPAVLGGVLIISITFSLMNLIVDLTYAFIDPRTKAAYEKRKAPKHKKPAEVQSA